MFPGNRPASLQMKVERLKCPDPLSFVLTPGMELSAWTELPLVVRCETIRQRGYVEQSFHSVRETKSCFLDCSTVESEPPVQSVLRLLIEGHSLVSLVAVD